MKITPSRGNARCLPCGKKMFATREGAENRLEEIALGEGVAGKAPQRTYRCPNGNGWHLTSMSDQKRSSIHALNRAMQLAQTQDRARLAEPRELRLLREAGLTPDQAAWAADLGYDLTALNDSRAA